MATRDVYTVVIAKYGTRSARLSEVFLNYAQYGQSDGPIQMDYFVWLVRNDERTIVVDTGFSAAGGAARGRTMLIEPGELFDRLGVPAGTTSPVIVTHAHYDHIGNLARFSAAPVIVAERELTFWSGPMATRRLFHHSVEDAELDHLAGLSRTGRVTAFRDRHLVAPGVELIELGGHTPGQSVVRVRTTAGTVLLASDAVHYQLELEQDMPFSSVVSVAEMYAGFDTIRAMQASGEVDIVVAGHDPGTLARFTPAAGNLADLVATIGGPG